MESRGKPPVKTLELSTIAILALLALWIAYKIGRFVLRLLAGLLVLALVIYLLWWFFTR